MTTNECTRSCVTETPLIATMFSEADESLCRKVLSNSHRPFQHVVLIDPNLASSLKCLVLKITELNERHLLE